jgi:hypothetical protein
MSKLLAAVIAAAFAAVTFTAAAPVAKAEAKKNAE